MIFRKLNKAPPSDTAQNLENTLKTGNRSVFKKGEVNNMTREMMMKEIQNRGYLVQAKDIEQNGVTSQGIIIKKGINNRAIICIDGVLNDTEYSLDEAVDIVLEAYERARDCIVSKEQLERKEYILPNLFIGLRKDSTEGCIKRKTENFDGIESYLYIRLNVQEDASIDVTQKILEKAGITVEEAWKVAESNTYGETIIQSVTELLGLPFDREVKDTMPMCAVTNPRRRYGASGILNKKALKKVADKYGISKLLVLPSSIHEMMILPYADDVDIDEMNNMVQEVNAMEVMPREQLADRAFVINL